MRAILIGEEWKDGFPRLGDIFHAPPLAAEKVKDCLAKGAPFDFEAGREFAGGGSRSGSSMQLSYWIQASGGRGQSLEVKVKGDGANGRGAGDDGGRVVGIRARLAGALTPP